MRKAVGKKLRFEVFKRDAFTCQYCGTAAPVVILELDHIDPVAKGGTNDITNLVTSCHDCNNGKRDIKLDDHSVVEKQHKQLSILQERREQINMMFEWKKSLRDVELEKESELYTYIEHHISPYVVNDGARKKLARLFKKHELSVVLDAIDLAANKYIRYDTDGDVTQESADIYFSKIGGVLVNLGRSEIDQKLSYIKGICRNRLSYWDSKRGSIILGNYVHALRNRGWSDEKVLKELNDVVHPFTVECTSWSSWRDYLEKRTQDINSLNTNDEDTDKYSVDDIHEYVNDVIDFYQWTLIEALTFVGKAFKDYDESKLTQLLNSAVIQFLDVKEKRLRNTISLDSYNAISWWRPVRQLYGPIDGPVTNGLFDMVVASLEKYEEYLTMADAHEFDADELVILKNIYSDMYCEEKNST